MNTAAVMEMTPDAITSVIISNRPQGTPTIVRTGKVTAKQYRCKACGHVSIQTTNHWDKTWSFGHFNTCTQCPPYKKYPEFGGQTVWECMEQAPA